MLADGGALRVMQAVALFRMASDSRDVRAGLHRALQAEPLSLLSADDRSTAEIVLAEVLNNIAEHAYAQGDGTILLSLALGHDRLDCVIEDQGGPMPGGALPEGAAPDPARLPEGGFGWHLIRTLCCDLSYERIGPTNRLKFSLPAERSRG
ncbi:MAG: ATP-binding protein [Paracoccaceae bacterium]